MRIAQGSYEDGSPADGDVTWKNWKPEEKRNRTSWKYTNSRYDAPLTLRDYDSFLVFRSSRDI
jgi:hypothetical protein